MEASGGENGRGLCYPRRPIGLAEILRYQSKFAQELAEAAAKGRQGRKIDLARDFERAADEGQGDGKAQGSSDGPKPVSRSRNNFKRQRRRDREKDRGR